MPVRRPLLASRRSPLHWFAAVLLLAAAACGDDGATATRDDPLAGLAEVQRTDSAPEEPPDTASGGPGRIVGTVYGYEIGEDYDTVSMGVRLAGVAVTAYERIGTGGEVTAGDEVAETSTDANGDFELPVMPAGQYVITFVPPAGLSYRAGWTVGEVWSGSELTRWGIWLRKL